MCENGMQVLDEDKALSNVTFYSFPRKRENGRMEEGYCSATIAFQPSNFPIFSLPVLPLLCHAQNVKFLLKLV
jgi:hypothetical protein